MSITVAEAISSVPQSFAGRSVLAKFFRAAGDPSRLALLSFVAEVERSATECVEHLGTAQSRVSAHLACLVTCGLLVSRRQGRLVFYSVRDPRVLELLRLSRAMVADQAEEIASCTRVDAAPAG